MEMDDGGVEAASLGDRSTSDVIVRLRSGDGRDDRFYAHSAVLRKKCKYFATCLSGDASAHYMLDSRSCIELSSPECEVDFHIILLRLLYAKREDQLAGIYHNVRNAIGVVKVASRFGCDEIAQDCIQFLESVPWEESEEEEILKTLPALGSSVIPVFARLLPVDPAVLRQVFLSALTVATGDDSAMNYFPKLKTSAQEQVEYMLVEDDDAPLVIADSLLKSDFRNKFRDLFARFRMSMKAAQEIDILEESLLDKLSDLVWASRVLPRVNLLEEMVTAWLETSADIVRFLEDGRVKGSLRSIKLKVIEVTAKVLEAVGYGNVLIPPSQRTELVKVWLPYIRRTKPVLEAQCMEDDDAVFDSELCQSVESAMTSLVLSLPSGDQAEILSDWLKDENAGYPDLSEAFEVWCFRTKAAKRRLTGVGFMNVPVVTDAN